MRTEFDALTNSTDLPRTLRTAMWLGAPLVLFAALSFASIAYAPDPRRRGRRLILPYALLYVLNEIAFGFILTRM